MEAVDDYPELDLEHELRRYAAELHLDWGADLQRTMRNESAMRHPEHSTLPTGGMTHDFVCSPWVREQLLRWA